MSRRKRRKKEKKRNNEEGMKVEGNGNETGKEEKKEMMRKG